MSMLAALAIIFGVLRSLSGLPQAYKIFKRKSAKDISIISVLLVFSATIVWIAYGLEIMNTPILIANGVAACATSVVIFGWLKYGR
ncbi:hypothetical protein HN924_02135 [Candidatus Woesearchaeota archaeon]|jgi:MtN3 and saliva related transmembrane protein|nr:hypothetical protein [Candidatus Woesearchaeota archaeon]MBT7062743.1 hypothetical protein [Candidatus Woesearchaeota archaeon]MBT7402681.1 hypothetical protein [Candidatus Woesearchaeota archaeon]